MSAQLLEFFCLVFPDDKPSQHMFSVEVHASKTISQLKDIIKQKKPHRLKDIDADELTLWKLDPPIAANDQLQNVLNGVKFDGSWTGGKELGPTTRIHAAFPDLGSDHLHVLVQVPLPVTKKRPRVSTESDDVHRLRAEYTAKFPKLAPSERAAPSMFEKHQSKEGGPFAYCQRPASATSIPVTLLHPILGKFVDDSHTYKPTAEDNEFVLDLSHSMSEFFEKELPRQEAFQKILQKHYGIQLIAGSIGSYRSDGHRLSGGHMDLVTEAKKELAAGDREPYLQGLSYYREWCVGEYTKHASLVSSLPALLIFFCGASFGFAGLASTDRPHADLLGPIIPLFYHPRDEAMRETAARFFGAYRNAAIGLEKYYTTEMPNLLSSQYQPQPLFPYPNSYTPLSGDLGLQFFRYSAAFNENNPTQLVFYGQSIRDSIPLCIKFVRRYSKEAHQCCAEAGFAPRLYGFETLAGGWYMVVMEEIDPKTYDLYTIRRYDISVDQSDVARALGRCISLLHEKDMVHGDIRDSNVLVSKNGADVRLIDFDWAGKSGDVCYPMNVNRVEMWRPTTVLDGKIITKQDDIDMMKHMFDQN